MVPERVVVVGAGPVGMTAALALARRGVAVTVLEAGADLSTESRASTFHPPSLEILDELGVTERLLEVGLQAPVLQHRDFEEGVIADLDASVLADETRYPFRLQCEQHLLTRMIRDEIDRSGLDVELQFGRRVAGVDPSSEGATVRVIEGEPLAASFVVAADGAHSAVREAAGIAFNGLTYPERYLVLTTSVDLREVLPGLAYVNYISGPGDWCTLIRTNRAWRALFPVAPEQTAEEVTDPEQVQQRLAELGPHEGGYPVEGTSIYHVHQRLAATFRLGPLLLAGDAGHINNPLGGLGMNSGIQDAYFLARVLAAVLHRQAGEELLDRYSTVRRSVCESFVNRVGHSNYAALRERDPEARRQRADQMRALAADKEATRDYLRTALMLESVRRTREELGTDAFD